MPSPSSTDSVLASSRRILGLLSSLLAEFLYFIVWDVQTLCSLILKLEKKQIPETHGLQSEGKKPAIMNLCHRLLSSSHLLISLEHIWKGRQKEPNRLPSVTCLSGDAKRQR